MSAAQAIVAEVPIFSLLDPCERETLAELLDEHTFSSGQNIYLTGDAGGQLYIVRSGRVEVFEETKEGEKILVGEFESGEVFGEISLLDGGPRTATAVATEDCDVLSLDRESLFDLFKEHPHAAMDLLTMIGRRLRGTDELLRDRVTRNANVEADAKMSFGDRLADRLAQFGGSWTFISLFGTVLVCWIGLNALLLSRKPFDPYPFILLNLMLSMVGAIQAPVIMMSQNRQSVTDRIKADLDYQVNLKAELEVKQLHCKMDRVYETLQAHWSEYDRNKKRENKLSDTAKSPNDYY